MQRKTLEFNGIRWVDIESLSLSQIYLNADKLACIKLWFDPNDLSNFEPLPVHDFGNAYLTLTDGHSRAYTAYKAGLKQVPVVYDSDPLVTSETGQLLYNEDIIWCDRFGIRSVRDLETRILSDADYQILWQKRCRQSYHLLTQTTAQQRAGWAKAHPTLHLYGTDAELHTLYFEDDNGCAFAFPI